jgi:PKD repeat protein
MKTITGTFALVACALAASACTMKDQETPPLTGPSEFGTSVNVSVTPDVLPQDGLSQSDVMIRVLDSAANPVSDLSLAAEILVDNQVVDFGRLSAKSARTNGDGRATFRYTAPSNIGIEKIVDISVTPVGTNFGNHVPRIARIRLMPTGVRLPPIDMVAAFAFTPSNPAQGQTVIFDAQESQGTIAQYRWDFGDGRTATGQTTSHVFSEVGGYVVRLTLVDPDGRTQSISRSISVGEGAAPTADFAFSPANPRPNDEVRFNANASTAAPGRTIVSYVWDFGDGAKGSGAQVTRRYTQERSYNVTLTVTDDIGRTSVITRTVDVAEPEDDGGESSN